MPSKKLITYCVPGTLLGTRVQLGLIYPGTYDCFATLIVPGCPPEASSWSINSGVHVWQLTDTPEAQATTTHILDLLDVPGFSRCVPGAGLVLTGADVGSFIR